MIGVRYRIEKRVANGEKSDLGIDENEKTTTNHEPRNASMLKVVVVVHEQWTCPPSTTLLPLMIEKDGQQISMQTIYCIPHMYNSNIIG